MHTGTQFTCFTSTKDQKKIRVLVLVNRDAGVGTACTQALSLLALLVQKTIKKYVR
jgi:hypothetical protein